MPTHAARACDGRRHRAARGRAGTRCRARSRIRLRTHAANATGFLNMLVGARDAGVKRFVYAASRLDLRRSSGSAQGRGRDRPPAVAVRSHQVSRTSCTPTCFGRCYGTSTIGLRYFNVFGPRQIRRRLRGSDSALGGGDAAGTRRSRSTATARRRATSAMSRTSCRRIVLAAVVADPAAERSDLQRRGRRANVAARVCTASCASSRSAAIRASSSPPPIHRGFSRRRRPPFAGRHRQGAPAARLRAHARHARRARRIAAVVRRPTRRIESGGCAHMGRDNPRGMRAFDRWAFGAQRRSP